MVIVENRPAAVILRTLKTEVVDICRREVPALAQVTRDDAYDKVLNDPGLLHSCFQLLRNRTELFDRMLVDANGVGVNDDTMPLTCGRTLDEVRTMILQASAKRFYRSKLGGPRRISMPTPKSLPRRVAESLMLVRPIPDRRRNIPGAGDRFFGVIREFLRFDWQARLIPPYAMLAPSLITKFGSLLFEIREPSEVFALASQESRTALADGKRPLFLCGVKQLMSSKNDTIDPELLWTVFTQMNLARLMPRASPPTLRAAIAQIAATSPYALSKLEPILGHNARLFVTFLFIAFAKLGEEEFKRTFRPLGATEWMIKRYLDRLAAIDPLPPPSFDDMVPVFSAVFAATGPEQAKHDLLKTEHFKLEQFRH